MIIAMCIRRDSSDWQNQFVPPSRKGTKLFPRGFLNKSKLPRKISLSQIKWRADNLRKNGGERIHHHEPNNRRLSVEH